MLAMAVAAGLGHTGWSGKSSLCDLCGDKGLTPDTPLGEGNAVRFVYGENFWLGDGLRSALAYTEFGPE